MKILQSLTLTPTWFLVFETFSNLAYTNQKYTSNKLLEAPDKFMKSSTVFITSRINITWLANMQLYRVTGSYRDNDE